MLKEVSFKMPCEVREEQVVQLVDEAYAEMIRRACWKVSADLGDVSRYVSEYQVTFQRVIGDYTPVITAVISENGVVKHRYTRGNITEPEMTTRVPSEDEIVGYFADFHDVILDHIDLSTILWDQIMDFWFQLRGKVARFARF